MSRYRVCSGAIDSQRSEVYPVVDIVVGAGDDLGQGVIDVAQHLNGREIGRMPQTPFRTDSFEGWRSRDR